MNYYRGGRERKIAGITHQGTLYIPQYFHAGYLDLNWWTYIQAASVCGSQTRTSCLICLSLFTPNRILKDGQEALHSSELTKQTKEMHLKRNFFGKTEMSLNSQNLLNTDQVVCFPLKSTSMGVAKWALPLTGCSVAHMPWTLVDRATWAHTTSSAWTMLNPRAWRRGWWISSIPGGEDRCVN